MQVSIIGIDIPFKDLRTLIYRFVYDKFESGRFRTLSYSVCITLKWTDGNRVLKCALYRSVYEPICFVITKITLGKKGVLLKNLRP